MIAIIAILVGVFVVYEWSKSSVSAATSGTSSGNGFLDAFANAIAKAENVDPSANNPGALGSGDVSADNIAGTFNDAGVVIIDSIENGWNALYNKLSNILTGGSSVFSPDMTIKQFAALYTTGDANNDSDEIDNYAQTLADGVGATPDTTLSDAQSGYSQ